MGQKIAIYNNNYYKPTPHLQSLIENETVSLSRIKVDKGYGAWKKYKMRNVCSLLK